MSKTSGPSGAHDDHGAATALAAGAAHDDADFERLHEHRITLRGSYGISNSVSVFARVPMIFRRLTTTTDDIDTRESSSGLGDLELSGVISHELISHPNSSYDIAVMVSVKTPTGRNSLSEGGERLDEHLQPGTGSWGGQFGGILSRTATMYSAYASYYVRYTAENDFDYRYGTAYLYNFGLLYRATSTLALTTEVNGRYSKRDREEGLVQHDTGGGMAYLTPGARWLLSPRVNLIVNVRIPVIQKLNDDQDEGVVVVGEIGLRR